ncbi:MAG: TonB-dependent receptor [Steroidobacteraceae bacterium]
MKIRVSGSPQKHGPAHARASTTSIATAVAAILSASAGTALAQEASPTAQQPAASSDQLETVVVTGIRHAIETSVAAKRKSDSIVETISAEDIGKLPDVSIAESLARLPGLTAQRVNGRAQVISIRGLAPRYASTLLNGREMVSTGDNRSVEYDQFPSELINGVTVYKTPDATLVGMGLSGTVNLQSVRPLDFHSRQVVFNARGETNSNGQLNADTSSRGARLSASYINQFADNTVGVALGIAYLNTPQQEEHYKSWWWADTAAWGAAICQNGNPCGGGTDPGTPISAIGLMGLEAGAASTKQARTGLMAVIEWKPSDNVHSTVDLYYSKFDQVENRRTLMSDFSTADSGWGGAYYTNPTTSSFEGNTVITGGNLVGLHPVDLSTLNKRQDTIKAAGWNLQVGMGNWTGIADLSYSKAHRDEQNAELEAGSADASGALPVSFNDLRIATGSGRTTLTPSINYSDPSVNVLSDPAGWGRDGRTEFPRVDDELKSIRFGLKRDLPGIFNAFEVGVNYSDRSKDYSRTEEYYFLKNNRAPISVSSDLLLRPTSLSFGGIPGNLMAFNFFGVLGKYYDVQIPPELLQNIPSRVWSVNEKVTTAYAKLGINTATAVPIHGNIGVQVVHAKQASTGFYFESIGQDLLPLSGGKTYTDVIPSLNLVFDVTPNTYVRFGFAKELARPNMEDMKAGLGVDVDDNPPHNWSASGGNPGLESWRSDAYDISLEHYFGKSSYISVATFYKNLKNFVYTQQIAFDPNGLVNPKPQFTPGCTPGCFLSTLANGHGGLVAGQEYTLSYSLGNFSPKLDGFGVILSASDTRSSLHEENNPTVPLDGLSGQANSLTGYYEQYGFSFRVSEHHRSKFQTIVRGTFGDAATSAILAETITDMQMGYSFEHGSLKGLQLLFQVNNIGNEPYRTQVGISVGGANPTALMPERYTTFGREYLLGATYKLN